MAFVGCKHQRAYTYIRHCTTYYRELGYRQSRRIEPRRRGLSRPPRTLYFGNTIPSAGRIYKSTAAQKHLDTQHKPLIPPSRLRLRDPGQRPLRLCGKRPHNVFIFFERVSIVSGSHTLQYSPARTYAPTEEERWTSPCCSADGRRTVCRVAHGRGPLTSRRVLAWALDCTKQKNHPPCPFLQPRVRPLSAGAFEKSTQQSIFFCAAMELLLRAMKLARRAHYR